MITVNLDISILPKQFVPFPDLLLVLPKYLGLEMYNSCLMHSYLTWILFASCLVLLDPSSILCALPCHANSILLLGTFAWIHHAATSYPLILISHSCSCA